MPYLIAAVVVVGVLCLLNLMFTYAVIHRLREHTELLAQRPAAGTTAHIAAPGSVVAEFTATTVDGDALTAKDLLPNTLVGFFSPHCDACTEVLPVFVDAAAVHSGPVLAVVAGRPADAADQVAALSPKARVVLASLESDIVKAFEVQGYPGFALIGDGRAVTTSGPALPPVVEAIA